MYLKTQYPGDNYFYLCVKEKLVTIKSSGHLGNTKIVYAFFLYMLE